jgi:hypothetical protein
MLSHEWRELELLCARISDLRHRYAAAIRTSNAGLVEGLKVDLARAKRLREMVIHHISARLGTAAADPTHISPPSDLGPGEHEAPAAGAPQRAAEGARGSMAGLQR